MVNIYSNVITISVSGGIVKCPEWYIQNPDGTYMGLEPGNTLNPLTSLNYVKVYHNGTYYGTAMLYVDQTTNAWYIPINISGGIYWFHVISGQCTP